MSVLFKNKKYSFNIWQRLELASKLVKQARGSGCRLLENAVKCYHASKFQLGLAQIPKAQIGVTIFLKKNIARKSRLAIVEVRIGP